MFEHKTKFPPSGIEDYDAVMVSYLGKNVMFVGKKGSGLTLSEATPSFL